MKPSSVRKVFGIISYFPNNDSPAHIETRRERSRRFKELLAKLDELWPDTDILVIAQNWQDFELPNIKNKIVTFHYDKLGILGARKELRKRFLESDYDYLIMLDDDGRILNADPALYMQTIDEHPKGIGVIRHRSCPLMFLAISKYIYEQIDMPDIDPEKGEGFEDDVFVAQCFARFPDNAYDFPDGCIKEHSLKYVGPGACPSTWAKEEKRDWDYMRAITNARIYALENPAADTPQTECTESPDVDVIITYVNSSDTAWVREYIQTTKQHNPSAVRFRSWGTLKYLFRGIAKYMPFVRNVILVVSKRTQVPMWINEKNVRIVYHEEFIPKKLLPTFNSCTIESFFWNIPNLADRVIYFNDDIFPVAPMTVGDFYTGNIPHIKFLYQERFNKRNIFRSQCRSGVDLITDALGLDRYPVDSLVCPEHSATPFVRSSMLKVGELCQDKLIKQSTKLRVLTNINQYVYAYYQYFTGSYVDDMVRFKYFDTQESNIASALCAITSEDYQIICLNDSDNLKAYPRIRYMITTAFNSKFPDKCKYEQ